MILDDYEEEDLPKRNYFGAYGYRLRYSDRSVLENFHAAELIRPGGFRI